MLVFIIPIKSAQVSKSWEQVSSLFERCIRSVCAQTSEQFQVIAVCHERPAIDYQHPAVTYIEVDYPLIPTATGNPELRYKRHDKCRKIWKGLSAAEQFAPAHVMFVDADDLVSNRLAEHTLQRPDAHGWYVNRGYEYQNGDDFIFLRKDFHLLSGTSNIVKYALLKPERKLDFKDVGWRFLWHQNIVDLMQERKTPLAPLSFPGAVYIVENGENIWSQTELRLNKSDRLEKISANARKLYKRLRAQPITPSMRNEFGLDYKGKA